jgi:membrane protein DedA with SNARE-associated domain
MQKAGLILIVVGLFTLLGYFCSSFFLNPEIPLAIRISVGVIAIGVVVLIVKVIRDRMISKKSDKFKEVER